MKKITVLVLLLMCNFIAQAQKNQVLLFPAYIAYDQGIPRGELHMYNGFHVEVPFFTIGADWASESIGSKTYKKDIHGNFDGSFGPSMYTISNIHMGINIPTRYVRPTIGINLTAVPSGLTEGNKIWLQADSYAPGHYYDSALKSCYVGFYLGVTSAIPKSPVQVGIAIMTHGQDIQQVLSSKPVTFSWNIGVDLAWLYRFFQER